jgi:hypothetical protein
LTGPFVKGAIDVVETDFSTESAQDGVAWYNRKVERLLKVFRIGSDKTSHFIQPIIPTKVSQHDHGDKWMKRMSQTLTTTVIWYFLDEVTKRFHSFFPQNIMKINNMCEKPIEIKK